VKKLMTICFPLALLTFGLAAALSSTARPSASVTSSKILLSAALATPEVGQSGSTGATGSAGGSSAGHAGPSHSQASPDAQTPGTSPRQRYANSQNCFTYAEDRNTQARQRLAHAW
jgi:hypothetical protein